MSATPPLAIKRDFDVGALVSFDLDGMPPELVLTNLKSQQWAHG